MAICRAFNTFAIILLEVWKAFCGEIDLCSQIEAISQCDFAIPKQPMADLAAIVRSGINRGQCTLTMAEFFWDVGFFCPLSHFCAFGADLDLDFDTVNKLTSVNEPIDETCFILINSRNIKCSHVKEKLYDSGILKSWRQFSCTF